MSKRINDSIVISTGMGFLPTLCLIFITLKLCGVINWSWWWVLAPIWMPIVLVLVIIIILAIIDWIISLFN